MDRVTPQKNENAFKKWERERRWLIRGFWIFVSVFILVCVSPLVDPLVHQLVRTFFPGVPAEPTEPVIDQPWGLPAVVGLGLLYIVAFILIRWRIIKEILGRLAKEACVFAAIVAAEDLDGGNAVRACLSMDRLLLALSDYLELKLVPLGLSSAAPSKYMQVTPETIPKRAVFRAIQASEDTKEFQESLRDLAIGLHGNEDAGYPAAHQFLVWLDRTAEPYRKISQSFLDKRPTLRTMLLKVAPVFLPPVSAIVVVLLRT